MNKIKEIFKNIINKVKKICNNIKIKELIKNIKNKLKKVCNNINENEKIKKIKNKIADYFHVKQNRITFFIILGVFLLVIIIAIIFRRNNSNKFSLNDIYDVYPEEVKELYSNMVDVSCNGDLFFDIVIADGNVSVDNIDRIKLLDYLFSYLDKNNLLNDAMDKNVIDNASKQLFAGDIDFKDLINDYNYKGNIYSIEDANIVKKEGICESSKKYISFLSGYSHNKKELSIDVNVGYVEDSVLYDILDNKLGEYTGDTNDLRELFINSANYKLNYIKDKNEFKLKSISLNEKI